MSFYRTYINKDATIYKNSEINTGMNPIGELFFSSDKKDCNIYSRHLIGFDLSDIIEKYLNCELGDLSDTKHILTLYNAPNICDQPIAKNVDIVAYKLCQDFTEGCGYDHNANRCSQSVLDAKKNVYSIAATNWFESTYCNRWCEEGTVNFGNLTCNINSEKIPNECIPIFERIEIEYLPESNHNSGYTLDITNEMIKTEHFFEVKDDKCKIEIESDFVSTFSATTTTELSPLVPRSEFIYIEKTGNTTALTYNIDILETIVNTELQYYADFDFSATSEIIDTINIDCTNYCGIKIDLTDCINEWITNWVATSGETDDVHAIGLSYHPKIEMYGLGEYSLSFYNRHTTSYFKPHLDTICEDRINDNRTNFELDQPQKLYMQTSYDLDINPTFNLYDTNNCLVLTADTRCVNSNTYCAEITVTGDSECEVFKDVWTDIYVNGKKKKDIMNRFSVADDDGAFNFNVKKLNYGLAVSGIQRNENIKRGDKRRISINLSKPFSTNMESICNPREVQYRLFVKQGLSDIDVICWSDVNILNCQYFIDLDTSWMLPTEYIIEVKVIDNNQVKTNTEQIKFNIIHDASCFSC